MNNAKVVYVAHQIGSPDPEILTANINAILAICDQIHTDEITPFAPYLVTLQYLDDNVARDKVKGVAANIRFFHKRTMDETGLFGPSISDGVEKEIIHSVENFIPIRCYNPRLQGYLLEFLSQRELSDELVMPPVVDPLESFLL